MKDNKLNPVILFITQLYPFPPDMGGTLRTSGTIRALLSLGYEVRLISITDDHANTEIEKALNRQIYKNLSLYTIKANIIDDFHPFIKFWRFFKSVFLFQPYKVIKYSSNHALKAIRGILDKDHPEVIYLDHLSSGIYLNSVKKYSPSAKIVLDIHDIESQLSHEKFIQEKSIFIKMVFWLEYLKYGFFERKVFEGVDKVFVMSQQAKKNLESRINLPISIIPISLFEHKSIPLSLRRPKKKKFKPPNQITFIGTLSLDVNKNGLKWFIDKVWPLIRIKVKDARFVIVGSYGRNRVLSNSAGTDGVMYAGYRRDLDETYKETTVGVIPMLVGGTVRMKTLGFLAHGVAVVSTTAGVYGIPMIKDGVHCLIENSAGEFAEKIIGLLKNYSQRKKIAQNAIALVKNYYTFEKLQRFLNYELNQLLSRSRQKAAQDKK